jgi:fido (protein-threonine AMPylation protein)
VLWYSHFWLFVKRYLDERYADGYCLNAEASLDLHVGTTIVPRQLIVMTREGGMYKIQLPHGTSILTYPDASNLPDEVAIHAGIRVMPLSTALCRVSPRYFLSNPIDAGIALNMVDENELSRALISGRNTRAASRLMGAYQFLNNGERARRIKQDMQVSGSRISPTNPFATGYALLGNLPRLQSPQVGRLRAMWAKLRPTVIEHFPQPEEEPDAETYLASLDDIYQHDAYHSLSIEGYRVTPEIIEKVRSGDWNPAMGEDHQHVAAMAAKGYHDAYKLVKEAVRSVLEGGDPAALTKKHLQDWYRALFSASIQAGILEAVDVAGYRNRPVYIRGSSHVPPPSGAMMDCMETLFDLLANEPSAAVRAVLGHFTFVFIHPYPDGNGRVGRFLMNLMLASGGYPWTVTRLMQRHVYMNALEQASVHKDIAAFTDFIAEEMQVDWTKVK